ncbi:hypothetical protein NZK32_03945 [Cyanobium sp. FGCU-52]|nr:hypothetical protein [Cyanobium sp. FGCU52]
MYDCEFEEAKLIHLHISKQAGSASVLSSYRPGSQPSHSRDVREARESEGRLVAPGNSLYVIELFLLNDRFGEKPEETVILRIARDGRVQLKGRGLDGRHRLIDSGTCSSHAGHYP